MRTSFFILGMTFLLLGCAPKSGISKELKESIQTNESFDFVKQKALEVVKTGFNAGDGYGEVWIRDYNTFIELSAEVYPREELKENLRVFFRLQGDDGNILDGFIPQSKAVHTEGGYKYFYSDLEPNYCGHKNTVETDHESSLVQAVYKYVMKTGDREFLNEKIGDKTVAERLQWSMEFLMNHRWSADHGLIWGATTADWGDVQHSHPWGVYITDDTKYCLDIYDNAMMLIALNNIIELLPETKSRWKPVRDKLAKNTMKHLWDESNQKFIPHVYLDGSPYPDDFNENEIFYHGGTAVAIEAGLLNRKQIKTSLDKMIANVKASGAGSIGLTMYPPYPGWAFENKGMYPYGYQNGGDWTWFGARMIQQLVKYGFYQEAYEQLLPMTERVQKNDGFFEWYTVNNEPTGSGTFRGSAGVLYKAIEMLENVSEK
ncbi:GH36-type glycosyl hydrolase domain-containing protein [Carboxylicivirga sp. RSCT41]|uniref:GH36-type glycosyl hydrolase domain-containing protein n=1 Tax=Carboxylicivirga agarovorans TaxID=3417570 RepID=UPI003D3252F0